eukprot:395657-Pleurochrysis_carterae.AAC.6
MFFELCNTLHWGQCLATIHMLKGRRSRLQEKRRVSDQPGTNRKMSRAMHGKLRAKLLPQHPQQA